MAILFLFEHYVHYALILRPLGRDYIKKKFLLLLRLLRHDDDKKSLHENKKALSPFYHKNIFDRK